MIAYDLTCANGHRFEGWFDGADAFESQHARGLIACPVCNDIRIRRMPSAFAIRSGAAPQPADGSRQGVQKRMAHHIVDYVENHFDNVGTDFAKEALKMHYGVVEARNIRGVSSEAEEKLLKDEGVQFFKFPVPKPSNADES